MKVNQSNKAIDFSRFSNNGPEQSPKFIMRRHRREQGDIVEISEIAREKFADHAKVNQGKTAPWESPIDLGDLREFINSSGNDDIIARTRMVEKIRSMVAEGLYDFDDAGRAGETSEMIIALLGK